MTPEDRNLLLQTRRHFFNRCGIGLGQIALAQLLKGATASNPMAPKAPHFPAKVKNVIYLFMAGGPSQFELFEHKPALQKFDASRFRSPWWKANGSRSWIRSRSSR